MSGDSTWYAPSLSRVAGSSHTMRAGLVVAEPTAEMQYRRLEAVLQHCKEFVATVDAEWRFTFVNQQFLRTYGLTKPSQALGKTPFDLYPDFRKSIFFSAMDDVMTRRRSVSRVGFSELTRKWYLCRGVPINGGAALFATDITDDQENREKLVSLSAEDPLTGAPNRVALETWVSDAVTAGKTFRLAVLGLNRLKSLSDALGRSAADQVVLEVASRLAKVAGVVAQSFRTDTEEFTLVSELGPKDFDQVLQKAMMAICEPITVRNLEFQVTCSAGLVLAPEHGDGVDRLLGRAGLALATARRRHLPTVTVFEPAMEFVVADRLRIENEMRKLLGARALEVRYEPRVEVRTGRPLAMEARIQWTMPSAALVPEATIRAVAAEAGMLAQVDLLVLDTVLGHASVLRGVQAPFLVPLSSALLSSSNALETLRAKLAEHRVSASSLEVEVDEATLEMDVESELGVIAGLAGMGIKVVASGLGAGYKTLGYLARSKVSGLRIGASLVSRLVASEEAEAVDPAEGAAFSRVIVSALVGIAHELKLSTVATGVLTPLHVEVLRQMNCDAMVGPAVAPPMSIREAPAFLTKATVAAPAKPDPYA